MGLERCCAPKIPLNSDYSSAAPQGQLLLTLNFRNVSKSRSKNMTTKTPSATRPQTWSNFDFYLFYFKDVMAF